MYAKLGPPGPGGDCSWNWAYDFAQVFQILLVFISRARTSGFPDPLALKSLIASSCQEVKNISATNELLWE